MRTQYAEIPMGPYEFPPMFIGSWGIETTEGSALVVAENILREQSAIGEEPEIGDTLLLASEYMKSVTNWHKGDMIHRWIVQSRRYVRQTSALCSLLPVDLWPNSTDASLAYLVRDKLHMSDDQMAAAVGARLTFRHHPGMSYFAQHGLRRMEELFGAAYESWLAKKLEPIILLPPDCVKFQIINLHTPPPFLDGL